MRTDVPWDIIIKSAVQASSDKGVTSQQGLSVQSQHLYSAPIFATMAREPGYQLFVSNFLFFKLAVFYLLHTYGAWPQQEATQLVQIYDFVLL